MVSELLPLIPLRNRVIFPGDILPINVHRDKSLAAIDKAMVNGQRVVLANQLDREASLLTEQDFHSLGVIAKIKQMLKVSDDSVRVLVEGEVRAKIEAIIDDGGLFLARVSPISNAIPRDGMNMVEARMREAKKNFARYAAHSRIVSEDIAMEFNQYNDPFYYADRLASILRFSEEGRLKVLGALDIGDRLSIINDFLVKETEVEKIKNKIHKKTDESVRKLNREHILREQLRTIQAELGDVDGNDSEIEEYKKQLDEIKDLISEEVFGKLEKEIERIKDFGAHSSNLLIERTHLNTIFSLPWRKRSEADVNIRHAEEVLEKDHYGLKDVKERILEFIAVMKLTNYKKAQVLCLVGPPGVGKTSIGESIARALGKKYVRMSLGGVDDEAEIRGHRRTYTGAIPGRIINNIIDAGEKNCVFLLDEIDKLGLSRMGDPAAALLELFDSEQNKYFTDHYLEIPFDFSEVFFITTANTLDTIPEPLLDRMEVIEISGYTIEEKKNIARQYLLPKKEKEAGISEVKGVEIKWGRKAIGDIIDLYTRESGVRNLEKAIAKIIRKIAREIVANMDGSASRGKIVIDDDALIRYLGKPKFLKDAIDKKSEVGVVTGLAWTPFGGTVLEIETSTSLGSGELIMTGQLGDVMKESVTIAIGYIRSRGADFGLPADYFDKHDINIHVPEGAVKKDGPSAGVTIFAALVSCLTNIKAKKSIAMTGEITLRGKITAVGGIKEKVLAAFRLGIRRIILPKENEVDVDEIPEKERKKIEIIYIEEASEALDVALQKNPL